MVESVLHYTSRIVKKTIKIRLKLTDGLLEMRYKNFQTETEIKKITKNDDCRINNDRTEERSLK